MHKAGLTAAATVALVLAAALATESDAQPHSAKALVDLGNAHWARGRCFDAAMNYYALLQYPHDALGAAAVAQLTYRIGQCRRAGVGGAGVGGAGVDGKADQGGRPPDGDGRPLILPPASPGDPATFPEAGPENVAETSRARACRRYAATVNAQSRILAATECGRRAGWRSFAYQDLYNWCAQRATPENVRADANRRTETFNSCTLTW